VPFRVAHHAVGGLVARAEAAGIPALSEVPAGELVGILAASGDEAARGLARDGEPAARELLAGATIDGSLAAADVTGGTAPRRVAEAIAAARARLDARRP
jgi:argininosuccinate lyase